VRRITILLLQQKQESQNHCTIIDTSLFEFYHHTKQKNSASTREIVAPTARTHDTAENCTALFKKAADRRQKQQSGKWPNNGYSISAGFLGCLLVLAMASSVVDGAARRFAPHVAAIVGQLTTAAAALVAIVVVDDDDTNNILLRVLLFLSRGGTLLFKETAWKIVVFHSKLMQKTYGLIQVTSRSCKSENTGLAPCVSFRPTLASTAEEW
jgi:hypothetical protein